MSTPSATDGGGCAISIRTGSGTGATTLSAFDDALHRAGAADLNLIALSSVIPPGSRITLLTEPAPRVEAGFGDRLYCVLSTGYAREPGETVWAGLGWALREDGGGLFVEHHAGNEASVREQIQLSLADMTWRRGGGYGETRMVLASAHYVDQPVCALVVAPYATTTWATR